MYIQLILSANFLRNFLHTPYYTVHGTGSTWSSKSNQALGKLLVGKQFTRSHVRVLDFTHKYKSISIQWTSQLKFSVQKVFRSNKLSSHLHTINAYGACIITVVRRSAQNSMLHKRLKWNNKTQSKFMTITAFHPKTYNSMYVWVHLAISYKHCRILQYL